MQERPEIEAPQPDLVNADDEPPTKRFRLRLSIATWLAAAVWVFASLGPGLHDLPSTLGATFLLAAVIRFAATRWVFRGRPFVHWSLFLLAAFFAGVLTSQRAATASHLEACSFRSTAVDYAVAFKASHSECVGLRGKASSGDLVPFSGSYPARCTFVWPAHRGWKVVVESRDPAIGQRACALETRNLVRKGKGGLVRSKS